MEDTRVYMQCFHYVLDVVSKDISMNIIIVILSFLIGFKSLEEMKIKILCILLDWMLKLILKMLGNNFSLH